VSNAEGTVTYEWEWDENVVGTQSYYVPNGPSEGWHSLTVTVWDDVGSDWDVKWVEVDDSYSCF
jgi:hypothetical protein